jgi:hypothetical protein
MDDGDALGPVALDDDETNDGAIIRRKDERDRRVVGRIEANDTERQFTVLVVRAGRNVSRSSTREKLALQVELCSPTLFRLARKAR